MSDCVTSGKESGAIAWESKSLWEFPQVLVGIPLILKLGIVHSVEYIVLNGGKIPLPRMSAFPWTSSTNDIVVITQGTNLANPSSGTWRCCLRDACQEGPWRRQGKNQT